MLKKIKTFFTSTAIIAVIALVLFIAATGSLYTVAENEYACVFRFSKIVDTVDTPGLHFKIPFIDTTVKFPNTTLLYDIPPSEVLTSDKKSMTVDCYILWKITDPQVFYQTLGTIGDAKARLNNLTYNSLKNLMGKLEQNDIINEDDASERNDIYANIKTEVGSITDTYGIDVIDIKIKRFDLPEDNAQAVYSRMISDRNQIAEKYIADGEYEASIIRNNVDKEVNIIVSNAEAEAARLVAEGESEYMRMLAEAYSTPDKKNFYEFMSGLDALKASLTDGEKTVIIGKDSKLGKLLIGN
ncbi:MAG: protease modulator HflC [Ruminococcaceae bacterium]|nr:protease modulator HflC [Oscillospiraceae bacterium]